MKATLHLTALLAGVLFVSTAFTPAAPPRAELLPEARQFDFWLGSWDVNLRIHQDDGAWRDSVRAHVKVYPVLDDKAVLELWDSPTIKGFSLRYFDPARQKWHLWLNWPGKNRSGSSGLDGTFRHGRGEFFSTRKQDDGSEIISRYSFSDITATSLRWDDAFSSDGGMTWRNNWIMEFTRTGPMVPLDDQGGPAHTWHDGSRCDLEPFRRFEGLLGARAGTVKTTQNDGSLSTEPATLSGYAILDGCSVLARLTLGAGKSARRLLMLLTWNTYADLFEASVLDDRPDTALLVLYGSESGDGILLTQKADPTAAMLHRHLWQLNGGAIRLQVERTTDQGASWAMVMEARFPR